MTKDLFGIDFYMLFSELCKIMVNKVTFTSCKGDDRPNTPGSAPGEVLCISISITLCFNEHDSTLCLRQTLK